MNDLIDVAHACDAEARLEKIYEWYFVRTMTTIRMAFGAAGVTFAALYGLVSKDGIASWLPWAVVVVIVIFAAMGIGQMRLLAQLHREFATALRLLAQLRARPGMKQDHGLGLTAAAEGCRLRTRIVIRIAIALSMAGLVLLVITQSDDSQELPLVVAACLVAIMLILHSLAETRRHHGSTRPPPVGEDPDFTAFEQAGTGDEQAGAGNVRLDHYVLEPEAAYEVNEAMRRHRQRESGEA